MKRYQGEFIDFLLRTNALKVAGGYTLKSGRVSPYFFNLGDLCDGESLEILGDAYAAKIMELQKPDVIFGPAYKGIPLAIATVDAFARQGINVSYAFDRKEAKDRGEAVGGDFQKKIIVGRRLEDGMKVVLLDDVFTTGDTKYEAIGLLRKCAKVDIVGVVIALDREEVDSEGRNGIEEFVKNTQVPVASIITASDVYSHLKKTGLEFAAGQMGEYLKTYGTERVKRQLE